MLRKALYSAIFTFLTAFLWAEGTLAASKTSLAITTSPPGAEVFLVDAEGGESSLGFTPISKVKVPRGTITLRIELEGYEELLEPVEIGRKAQNLVFNLVRKVKPGHLTVTTVPQFVGARLKVNGKILGALPQELSLKPGRHQAVVYLKGYKKWIRWLDVAEGQKLVFEVLLEAREAKQGSLMVASSPTGATVYLNQKERGKTPLAIDNLAADNYFVELRKEGYMLWKKAVRIDAGKRAIVDAILETEAAPKSLIKVSVDLSNAEIYLDGRLVGMSPSITLEVEPGNHDVEVRPVGRKPQTKSLRVEAGKTLDVAFAYKVATAPKDAAAKEPKPADPKDEAKPSTGAEKPSEKEKKEGKKEGGKDAENTKAEASDEEAPHGRALPTSGVVLSKGQGTLHLALGYPYLASLRASAGLMEKLDLSFAFRTIAHIINEFEVSGKYEFLRADSFVFAGEAGIGFGLGADDRNSFLLGFRGLASLLLGETAALTAHAKLHYFNDRNGPETNPAHVERTNALQLLLGLTLELAISSDWNLSLSFEGDPVGGSSCSGAGRCLYQLEFLEDSKMYGQIGFTSTF